MSQENVKLAYQANDAFNRRDIDALLALAEPDIEYSPRLLEVEGGGPYRGREGVRTWWENWRGIIPDFSTEIEEVTDLGDVTVVRVRLRGHGTASGATIDQTAWQVAEWRNKKCIRWRTFATEAEALEAAGLRE